MSGNRLSAEETALTLRMWSNTVLLLIALAVMLLDLIVLPAHLVPVWYFVLALMISGNAVGRSFRATEAVATQYREMINRRRQKTPEDEE